METESFPIAIGTHCQLLAYGEYLEFLREMQGFFMSRTQIRAIIDSKCSGEELALVSPGYLENRFPLQK